MGPDSVRGLENPNELVNVARWDDRPRIQRSGDPENHGTQHPQDAVKHMVA